MSKNTDLGNLVNGLFVSSTRNVGIGMSTPANAVVVDKGTATASYLQFTAGTTTGQLATDGFEVGIDASGNAIISQQENLPLMVYTNSAERLRINAVGNVGIGVIPSSWSVGRAFELGNLGNGLWNASAADTRLMTNVYFNGGFFYGSNGVASIMETGDGFIWRTAPIGTANASATFTERMRITSAGNVGIGTSSTGFNAAGLPLVIGSGSGNTGMTIFSGSTSSGSIHFADAETTGSASFSGFINYDHTGNSMQFGTTNTERMRITSGGNVGIGTSSPNQLLTLSSAAYPILGFNIGSTSHGYVGSLNATGIILNSQQALPIFFYTSDTERMRITSTGGVLINKTTDDGYKLDVSGQSIFAASAVTPVIMKRSTNDGFILSFYKDSTIVGYISTNANSLPSDFNFKKNINNLELGLNLVEKLRPVSYNRNIDDKDASLSTGFIAQELEQSLTELGVDKNKYYILQHTPNQDKTQSQYWVDYTKMIPVLTKAIQELSADLTSAKQEIELLKAK